MLKSQCMISSSPASTSALSEELYVEYHLPEIEEEDHFMTLTDQGYDEEE